MCQHAPAAVTQPCLAAAGAFLWRAVQGLSHCRILQEIVLLKQPGVGQGELLLFRKLLLSLGLGWSEMRQRCPVGAERTLWPLCFLHGAFWQPRAASRTCWTALRDESAVQGRERSAASSAVPLCIPLADCTGRPSLGHVQRWQAFMSTALRKMSLQAGQSSSVFLKILCFRFVQYFWLCNSISKRSTRVLNTSWECKLLVFYLLIFIFICWSLRFLKESCAARKILTCISHQTPSLTMHLQVMWLLLHLLLP